eukprot:scaffold2502_cov362-Prasinococcus_capsulatus_cf.AAC.9
MKHWVVSCVNGVTSIHVAHHEKLALPVVEHLPLVRAGVTAKNRNEDIVEIHLGSDNRRKIIEKVEVTLDFVRKVALDEPPQNAEGVVWAMV